MAYHVVSITFSDSPTIVSLSPTDDATDVAINTDFVVTFSRDVQFAATVDISLYRADDVLIQAFTEDDIDDLISISGDTLTISSLANLANGSAYYILIDNSSIEDLDSNAFLGIAEGDWSFTAVADLVAPTLTSKSPADNATGVPVNSSLTATFSENIQFAATVDISLHLTSDDSVVEAFTEADIGTKISITGTTLTIDPTDFLDVDVEHYVLIDAVAIEDLSGNAFAGIASTTTWSFTSAATGIAPAVPFMTWASTEADSTPNFNLGLPAGIGDGTDAEVGDDLVVQYQTAGGDWTSPTTYVTHTLISDDLSLTTIPETGAAIADGEYDFRARLERGALVSDWSADVSVVLGANTAEALDFISRLPSAPDATHEEAYMTLINTLVNDASGVWDCFDALFVTGDIQANNVVNLKADTFPLTEYGGSLTWTADAGYAGNGDGSHVRCSFNAFSWDGAGFNRTDSHVMVWKNNTGGDGTVAGVGDGLEHVTCIINASSANEMFAQVNELDSTPSTTGSAYGSEDRGLFVFGRNAATGADSCYAFKDDGTDMVDLGYASVDASSQRPTANGIAWCGWNNGGSASGNGAHQLSAFSFGTTMTLAQSQALYDALHAYFVTVAGITY